MQIGYSLGVEAINEAGGINGREVELIVNDDESTAETVRQELQQIVSNNDVQMIWGSFSSLLATAGSAFAEQEGLPFLAVAFASEAPHLNNDYEWTFAPFPKSRDVANSCTEMMNALDEPPQNIGLWELNSSWGAEQADAWEQHFTDAGYDVVLRETYSIGTSDFSSLISQSESAGVEALYSNPIPPDGIAAVKQMKSSGWAPQLLHFVRAADPQAWWSALGQDGAYAQMAPGWLPGIQGGGNDALLSAYDALDDKPTEVPLAMVGASYGLTQTARQAMSAASEAAPAAIRDALLSETFDTVLGQFEFEDNGMPVEGQITGPIGQWWDDRQRLVYPDVDSEFAMDTRYPIPPWGER
jgi:branched-chain amino acid transport system substrate-binding protein